MPQRDGHRMQGRHSLHVHRPATLTTMDTTHEENADLRCRPEGTLCRDREKKRGRKDTKIRREETQASEGVWVADFSNVDEDDKSGDEEEDNDEGDIIDDDEEMEDDAGDYDDF